MAAQQDSLMSARLCVSPTKQRTNWHTTYQPERVKTVQIYENDLVD